MRTIHVCFKRVPIIVTGATGIWWCCIVPVIATYTKILRVISSAVCSTGPIKTPVAIIRRLIAIVVELKLCLCSFRQGIVSFGEICPPTRWRVLYRRLWIIDWCRARAVHAHCELILLRIRITIFAHRHCQHHRSVGNGLTKVVIVDILVARLPCHRSAKVTFGCRQQHIFIDCSSIRERHLIMIERVLDGSFGVDLRGPYLLRRRSSRREGGDVQWVHVGIVDNLIKQYAFVSHPC